MLGCAYTIMNGRQNVQPPRDTTTNFDDRRPKCHGCSGVNFSRWRLVMFCTNMLGEVVMLRCCDVDVVML
jgi:hypothetical protein